MLVFDFCGCRISTYCQFTLGFLNFGAVRETCYMFISTRCCGCTERAEPGNSTGIKNCLSLDNYMPRTRIIPAKGWTEARYRALAYFFFLIVSVSPNVHNELNLFLECPICSVLHLKQARSPRILTSFLGKPFPPNGWFISKILVLVDFQGQSPPWNLENFVPFVCVFAFFPVCFLVPSPSPQKTIRCQQTHPSRHGTSSRKRSLCLVEHWKVDKESWEWIILTLGGSEVVFMLWICASYFWRISKNWRISPQNAWVLKYLVWKCFPYNIFPPKTEKREWIWPKKRKNATFSHPSWEFSGYFGGHEQPR